MSGEIKIFQLALERLMEDVKALKKENERLSQKVESLEVKTPFKDDPKITEKDDVLLDTKEVRKLLRISHNTLQAIVRSGKLKQIRINERNIRYSKSALDSYIASLSD